LETDPPADYVRPGELATALVDMLDDELRNLKMRIGILEARRKKIITTFPNLN